MNAWRNFARRHQSLLWGLIVVLLASILLPMHIHLHHMDGARSASHDHAVDVHLVADNTDSSHHDDATVLSVSPNALLKQIDDSPLPLAALFFLFVLVPAVSPRIGKQVISSDYIPRQTFHHFNPPLRAPPAV
jgi:hypothetical protein